MPNWNPASGRGLGAQPGRSPGQKEGELLLGFTREKQAHILGKGSGSPRKNVWGTIERRQRHKSRFQDGDRRRRLGWEDGIREGSRIAWVG